MTARNTTKTTMGAWMLATAVCTVAGPVGADELPGDVLAAAELGDELGTRPHALALDDDGFVVLADREHLVRLDAAGATVATRSIVGGIDDIAVDRRSGDVVVVGGGGLVRLTAELDPQWTRTLARGHAPGRLAVGEAGTVAVAMGDTLVVVDRDGTELGRAQLDGAATAVAVLDADDRVLVTGSITTSVCGQPAELAVLSAYGRDGERRWTAQPQSQLACDDERSASRGVDVTIGDDGMIYLLAEIEQGNDPFAQGAVAFDASSDRGRISSSLFAYYARYDVDGELQRGQYLGFDDEDSVVQPTAIAADRLGNVHVVGTTTHGLALPDEVAGEAEVVDALAQPSGFHQVVAADFRARLGWQLFEHDGESRVDGLALVGARAIALVHGAAGPQAPELPVVVELPDTSTGKFEKRPARDDVGTFGFESGASGIDPTCYCDAQRRTSPGSWLALVGLVALVRPRRRCAR